MDYLQALAQHYLKRGNFTAAGRIADQMIARHPEDHRGPELREFVKRKGQGTN
jgi:cytochrome c-type biogenesis protein CcmE